MARNAFVYVAVIVSGNILVTLPSFAAAKRKAADRPNPVAGTVEKVLRAEVVGQVNRREQLADVLREQPDSTSARWQAGFVRKGDSWRSFDQMSETTDSDSYIEYLRRRRQPSQTSAAQLNLANFCRDNGLPDQERAHLWASLPAGDEVVESAVLRRLGRVLLGNRWWGQEEIANWRETNRRTTALVKRWTPRLEKIAESLEGPQRQRELGLTKLQQLTNPAVIPAIEYVLCGREIAAIPAVKKLETMPEYEATLALAKQALFSKWPEVRRQAAQALKSRRFEDFARDFIALMATPRKATMSVRWQYSQDEAQAFRPANARIELIYCYIVARETDDQFQVDILQTVDYRLNELIAMRGSVFAVRELSQGIAASNNAWINGILLSKQLEMARDDAQRLRDAELALETSNERTLELNRRIVDALAAVSESDADPDPQVWWQWWSNFTDSERIGEKQTVVQVDETYLGNPSATFLVGTPRECFAAGTLVWTDHGQKPIEKISIGDEVLCKNIDTGELTYKPVLRTTIRPPRELCAIRVGEETIVCTRGHRFWNSGSGWIKTRDLESHTQLHTATGCAIVWGIKPAAPAETHNLVVADFHTYFVGNTGLLCQDLLIPQPTNNVVPGLSRASAVAQKKE